LAVLEEGLFYGRFPDKKGCFSLGAGQGAIWYVAQKYNIPVAFIKVQDWKKEITGKSSATKKDVRDVLISERGISPHSKPKNEHEYDPTDKAYDESDAIGVGIAYIVSQ